MIIETTSTRFESTRSLFFSKFARSESIQGEIFRLDSGTETRRSLRYFGCCQRRYSPPSIDH